MDAAADPSAILRQLDAIRAATLGRLAGLTQEQLDWRPPGEAGDAAWSLGEVFMHLAIDEYDLGTQLGRLWLEKGQPQEQARALPPPPYGVGRDELQGLFADMRTRTHNLIASWPAHPNLAGQPGSSQARMPGIDWLITYGQHEASHWQQMDALVAQDLTRMNSP
jgi:hypothetical protein